MQINKDIWIIVGDLGYKMWDKVRDDFRDRFINTGAAEQAMMGIAVGLALKGKIPIVYSITTFLLYRPFETIRNYINHEKIPVKLVGSGRDKDYAHDGFSHWSEDAWKLFEMPLSYYEDLRDGEEEMIPIFNNIHAFWPQTKEEIPKMVDSMIKNNKPSFISLRR